MPQPTLRSLPRGLSVLLVMPALIASSLLVISPAHAQKTRPGFWTALFVVPALVASSLLVTSTAEARRIGPNFFGMHDGDWTSPPSVPVGAANFTTSGTYWPSVETRKGKYNFIRLDQQVAAARDKRAKPMIVLGQTPRFYSSKRGSDDYADYMPKMKAWKRYVSKVAKRYGARLDYQIWPEPNIEQNWRGTPRQMAKLTAVASRAINRQSKKAKVVSPAVALRLKSQQTWMVKYFKQKVGGKRVHRYVDAIAIDPFPEQKGTPEDSFKLMRQTKKRLAGIGVRKPVWNNEINYGVAGAGDPTSTDYSVNKQQSFVIRTYALSAAASMRRTYWLGWFNTNTLAVSMATDRGRPLQPGKSYAVVRSWLNKTRFVGCDRGRHGLLLCTAKKGPKEVRRIYWKTGGKTRIQLPRSVKRVENQEGGVDKRPGRKIRVDFRPKMVASRR